VPHECVHAALSPSHIHLTDPANHNLPCVSDGRQARVLGDLFVGNARGGLQFVSESAQATAEHKPHPRAKLGLGQDKPRGAFGAGELFANRPNEFRVRAQMRIPTIEADIRLTMVPASMARRPSLASSLRLFEASAPIPPIWNPIELKFAKPQSASVAMVNERGSRVTFIDPRNENATSSLRTMRVPSKLPMAAQSCQGMPITQATGANAQPKTC